MTSVTIGEVKIVPMHMNAIFLDDFISIYTSLDEMKMKTIIEEIQNEPTVLDFSRVETTITTSTIEKLAKHINNKMVRLVNMNEHIYSQITAAAEYKLISESNQNGFYNAHTDSYPVDQYKEIDDLLEQDGYIQNEIVRSCKENVSEGIRKISSNVFTSKYFEHSKLFLNTQIARMVVYLLAVKVQAVEKEGSKKNIKFISSSINGGVIATMLGILFGYEHIGIPHLGSSIDVEDNRYLNLINKNDRLIYVFDIIALGNEQRMVYTIARLTNANIIASVGLSYYSKYIPINGEADTTDCIVPFCEIVEDIHYTASKEDMDVLLSLRDINE